jgi:hypothetical protein
VFGLFFVHFVVSYLSLSLSLYLSLSLSFSLSISSELDKEVKDLPPTPEYNAAILEDLCISLHQQLIEKTVKPFENVCDALILLKVKSLSLYLFFSLFFSLTNLSLSLSLSLSISLFQKQTNIDLADST